MHVRAWPHCRARVAHAGAHVKGLAAALRLLRSAAPIAAGGALSVQEQRGHAARGAQCDDIGRAAESESQSIRRRHSALIGMLLCAQFVTFALLKHDGN